MAVVSIKIPECLRQRMREYSDKINWPEEIRKIITAKIEELEREKAIEDAVKMVEPIPTAPRGTVGTLVREDRDRH